MNGERQQATGVRRFVYLLLGFLFLGLAYAGVVLPGLPTTPFLLLASYFFVRSSPKLARWLRRSRLFGPLLADWETHGAVRPWVKHATIATILPVATISVWLAPVPWVQYLIAVFALVGMTVVWRLPVVPKSTSELSGNPQFACSTVDEAGKMKEADSESLAVPGSESGTENGFADRR